MPSQLPCRKLYFLTLLFTLTGILAALPTKAQKTSLYFNDNEPKDLGKVVRSIQDGNSIILAGTSFDNYVDQPSLTKIDLAGNIVWTTTTKDKDVYAGYNKIDKLFLSNGFIYATLFWDYNGQAEFWKVNALTGDIVWKVRATFTEPSHDICDLDANTFIATFHDLDDAYNQVYRRVIAFIDKQTGKIIRTHTVGLKLRGNTEYSLAVDADKNIYYSQLDTLYKLSSTIPATILWKRRHAVANVRTYSKFHIDSNDNIYAFGSQEDYRRNGMVVAIEKSAGDLRWSTMAVNDDAGFSAMQDYNGSIYVTWQHLLHGGGYFDYWTTRIDKATGAKVWSSSHSFQGINGVPRDLNSEAAMSLSIDGSGDVYLNGYYNASNYGPGTWGLLKVSGSTGQSLYEKTFPEDLPKYHTESSGVSSYFIGGQYYVVGNMQVETNRYAAALIKVNQATGAATETHLIYGKYQYASQAVTIKKLPNNNVLVLKQEGRFVKVAQYTPGGTLVWEQKLGRPYMLYGDDLTIGPNGTIHVLCHARDEVRTTPDFEQNPANLCTFALNQSGQVLKETYINYYGSIWPTAYLTLPTSIRADATNEFVFYRHDNEMFLRRVSGTTFSNEIKLGYDYRRSPKDPVFDENATTLRLVGVENGVGPKIINIDKATLAQTSTVLPVPTALFYGIKQVVKLNANEVLLYGEYSYLADYLVRYNITTGQTVWSQRYATTRTESAFLRLTNNGQTCFVSGSTDANMYMRKIDVETGALYWNYTYSVPSFKTVLNAMVLDESKGKILLAGYNESTSNPNDKKALIDVVSTTGVHDYTIIKTSTKPWDNLVTTAVVSNGDFMTGGSHDHPGYAKAGFIYGLETVAAPPCVDVKNKIEGSICPGGSYTFDGKVITTPGVYSKNVKRANGCDSLVVLTLKTIINQTVDKTVTICSGSSFVFGGQVLKNAGYYQKKFVNKQGCDSTVNLTLNVATAILEYAVKDICEGDVYVFGGQTLSGTGVFTKVFKAKGGCDSTVVLTLRTNPKYEQHVSATLCQGESYEFAGQQISSSGVYKKVFPATGGCDSTIVLSVVVKPVYDRHIDVSLCKGETYLFGNQVISSAGSYSKLFQSVSGCDSTVTLNVIMAPSYVKTVAMTACADEQMVIGGNTLTTSGVYVLSLQSKDGCDSTLTVNFSRKAAIDKTIHLTNDMLLASQLNATYQWYDMTTNQPIPGATDSGFLPLVSGKYAVKIMYDGCSAMSETYSVNIMGVETQTPNIHAYPNPASNRLTIDAGETVIKHIVITDAHGVVVLQQTLNQDGKIEVDIKDLAPGVFVLTMHTEREVRAFKVVKQ